VEQPGTQMRIAVFGRLAARMSGKTRLFSDSKTAGSRKKLVTLIRMSWYSASSSVRSPRSRST
jgi:hypothetical protein